MEWLQGMMDMDLQAIGSAGDTLSDLWDDGWAANALSAIFIRSPSVLNAAKRAAERATAIARAGYVHDDAPSTT